MNTLKYSLEYQCYPIWNYDPSGVLVENDLPDELKGDQELCSLLLRVQDIFDSLYVNTPLEFSEHGFHSEEELNEFVAMLLQSAEILRSRYGKKYIIDCRYTRDSFSMD